MKSFFQKYGWPALTIFTFFFLLGSRSLNEPDEGRYAEIAREMIQTGDWLLPHLWYLPHLDKPPMTYWLVAASMKIFGQNEWAVRLPVALAGIAGVFATFLLGCSLGGRRVGIWSALILQSSLLYFVMSRFLTTDIFLTAFNAWAMYFFWRSWRESNLEFGNWNLEFYKWHLAGWVFVAFGFLTKGPVAFAIPAVSFLALIIFRRNQIAKMRLFAALICGFVLFLALAAPWFLAVFREMPGSANFMILGQAAGHFLGTTIKNRTGVFFYFFGILAVGLLPWTVLLGWLWRKNHWRNLDPKSKDGWLLLNVWAIFTFTLFTFSHAKLPAYILPIFSALAVLLAWRFFAEANALETALNSAHSICLVSALLLPMVFPLLMRFVFHNKMPSAMYGQTVIVFAIAAIVLWLARHWKMQKAASLGLALTLCGLFLTAAEIPAFETTLKANQTFKPLGVALRESFRQGDAVVCYGRLPQGLPFYSGDAISATNRPYFAGMDLVEMPFRFPGNRERLGDFLLPDDNALAQLLQSKRQIWLVGVGKTVEKFKREHPDGPLRSISRVGQWQLYSNR